jgi:hypothetical protein
LQREIHTLAARTRFLVVVAHRQFGKTTVGINECLDAVLFSAQERPRAAYVCPFRSQAKAVAWESLKALCRVIPGVEFNETELRTDFPAGGRIVLAGADNADALRGNYFDLVVLDEFAFMEPRVWPEILRPTLSSRNGRAIFIGTPFGRNHFFDLFTHAATLPEWGRVRYQASTSAVLSAAELASATRSMSAEQFAQEYECEWTAVMDGSIYGKALDLMEKDGRLGHIPHHAGVDVHTSWDIGYGDATAIWFAQTIGPAVHLIDYYEASGAGIEHYIRILREKSERFGYRYGRHYGPHDTLAGSIQTGRSLADIAREAGLTFTVVKRGPIETGINETRKLLEVAWVDGAKCQRGVEALQAYRRTWNEQLRMFSEKPVHDWASHACDALGTGAVGGLAQAQAFVTPTWTCAEMKWNPFDWGRDTPPEPEPGPSSFR